jgi:hypothetical protein
MGRTDVNLFRAFIISIFLFASNLHTAEPVLGGKRNEALISKTKLEAKEIEEKIAKRNLLPKYPKRLPASKEKSKNP